jgi:hypothetical protein
MRGTFYHWKQQTTCRENEICAERESMAVAVRRHWLRDVEGRGEKSSVKASDERISRRIALLTPSFAGFERRVSGFRKRGWLGGRHVIRPSRLPVRRRGIAIPSISHASTPRGHFHLGKKTCPRRAGSLLEDELYWHGVRSASTPDRRAALQRLAGPMADQGRWWICRAWHALWQPSCLVVAERFIHQRLQPLLADPRDKKRL